MIRLTHIGKSTVHGYRVSRIASMRDSDIDQINIDDAKKLDLKNARNDYNRLKSLLTSLKERKITYKDMDYDNTGRVNKLRYELK